MMHHQQAMRRPPALCSSSSGSGAALRRPPIAATAARNHQQHQRRRCVVAVRAATTEPTSAAPQTASNTNPPTNKNAPLPEPELAALIAKLKASVRQPGRPGASLSGPQVVDALVALERQRLPADGWRAAAARPGARWRLVYTAPEKVATAASKRQPHGPATVFPLTAAQFFDDATGVFTNGVFLGGGLASLTFAGPFDVSGRLLQFDVCKMAGNLGPWKFSFPIKKNAPATLAEYSPADRKKLPFFSYIYADDEMIVARGRSGGLAAWARADAGWLAETGVTRIYG